jgi:hypothetical protein
VITFQSVNVYHPDSSPLYTSVTGDFNSDDHLDLVVYAYSFGRIDLFLGFGNGSFEAPKIFITDGLHDHTVLNVDDFNEDGHLDLVMSLSSGSDIHVFLGNGDGNLRAPITSQIGDNTFVSSIVTADFNGDGHVDIAIGNYRPYGVGVLFGYGNGTVAVQTILWSRNTSWMIWLIFGDFNGDSRLDIAFADYENWQVRILLGLGGGTFMAPMTLPTGNYSYPSWSILGDFNRDSHLDIAVLNIGNYEVGVFLGTGDGNFQTHKTSSTHFFESANGFVDDFTGDGQLDLLCYDRRDSSIALLLGHGDGTFGRPMVLMNVDPSLNILLGVHDFNSDERWDLLVVATNALKVLLNTCPCYLPELFNTSIVTDP